MWIRYAFDMWFWNPDNSFEFFFFSPLFPLSLYSLWFIALLFSQPSLPFSQHPLWLRVLVRGGSQARGWNIFSLWGLQVPLPTPTPLPLVLLSSPVYQRLCSPGVDSAHVKSEDCTCSPVAIIRKKMTQHGRAGDEGLGGNVQSRSCSDSTLWHTTYSYVMPQSLCRDAPETSLDADCIPSVWDMPFKIFCMLFFFLSKYFDIFTSDLSLVLANETLIWPWPLPRCCTFSTNWCSYLRPENGSKNSMVTT